MEPEPEPAMEVTSEESLGLEKRQAQHCWQWKWGDVGTRGTRSLARVNPLRWSKVMESKGIVRDLGAVRGSGRPVELRLVGESKTRDFATVEAAISWLEQQQGGGDARVEIADVFLYDCSRKSRQQGRLVVTATHLTFQPAIETGRKVSFPLHIILETRAVSHGGSPLKIEATVLVPDQEQPARIALEFADRHQERDATLLALRRAGSALGSVEAIRATLQPEPEAPKDDVVCEVLLRRDSEPESVRMVLGVDSLSFEPGDDGPAGGAEGVAIALTQL
eukprot:COSAG02_NODE_13324_length_1408_cov_1.324180_1_plen_277_part_10